MAVEALDRDYNLAWKMRYQIEPNGVAENWFDIDEYSGEIFVKQKIDREDDSVQSSNGNFQFVVKANTLPFCFASTAKISSGDHLNPFIYFKIRS